MPIFHNILKCSFILFLFFETRGSLLQCKNTLQQTTLEPSGKPHWQAKANHNLFFYFQCWNFFLEKNKFPKIWHLFLELFYPKSALV
jgi:hypothetical protein